MRTEEPGLRNRLSQSVLNSKFRSRLGSHRANCLRCRVLDAGSWPAVGEHLQSITSSLETPWLDQGCPLCSRRDRINAKVPVSKADFPTGPRTTIAEGPQPRGFRELPVTGCSPFMLPAPRGQEPGVGGGSEKREGKGPPSLSLAAASSPTLSGSGWTWGREGRCWAELRQPAREMVSFWHF